MSEARFCSQCGGKLQAEARFCVDCGLPVAGARRAVQGPLPLGRYAPAVVVGVVLLVGGVVVAIGVRNPKTPPSVPGKQGAAGGGQLPAGHPPISVPDDVKQSIAKMAKDAEAQPDNIPLWQQLAEVQYRASEMDPSYLAEAQRALEHIIEQQPSNAEALRNLGNVAFDREQPTKAVEYYTRYLVLKPDDKNVQTDMATMMLAAGKVDEAIAAYQKILASDASFFQAQFNLGLAYQKAGNQVQAVAALQKARALAPDEKVRGQLDQMIGRVQKTGTVSAAAASGAPSAAAGTLREGLEEFFRSNQIIGPKLDRFDWADETHVRVLVSEFPIAAMPDDVRQRFADRIREQIKEQKQAHQTSTPVQVQLVDSTSGEAMETISE
jgi:tetratricopeptide (TPR) repeat protein